MVAPRILIVEDEELSAKHLAVSLARMGYEVVGSVTSGEAALEKAAQTGADLVLMDVMLEGEMDGIQAAELIRSRYEIPVVYLTAYEDQELVTRASRTKPYGYLLKPFRQEEIRTTIEMALFKHRVDTEARLELERLVKERTEDLVRANDDLQREITERRAIEKELRKSEERYRTLFSQSLDPIAITTVDGHFLEVNDSFVSLVGQDRETIMQAGWQQLWAIPEDGCQWIRSVAENGSVKNSEWVYMRKDGSVRICLLNSTVQPCTDGQLTCQTICHDVTDSRRAQDLQTRHAKVRAVADLAIGVAHNFNNLLQVVISSTDVALHQCDILDLDGLRSTITQVRDHCRLTSESVKRLQSYAGLDESPRARRGERFDLSDIAVYAVEMAKPWWESPDAKHPGGVCLDLETERGCVIEANQHELFQVILDLLKNSFEALQAGGTIEVRTRAEGAHVVLQVRDTGPGMSRETLNRLFTPFFTTKAQLGRGLGLATAQRILERHRGTIEVESVKGIGTTVTVRLPAQGAAHHRS